MHVYNLCILDEELDEEDLDLIQENLGIRLPKVTYSFLKSCVFNKLSMVSHMEIIVYFECYPGILIDDNRSPEVN